MSIEMTPQQAIKYPERICDAFYSELRPLMSCVVDGRRVKDSKVRHIKKLVKYSKMCGGAYYDLVRTVLWFDGHRILS